MTRYKLSKSTFIRGLQCEKSLYLYKHHYKLKDPTPSSLQAVYDQGKNIGLFNIKRLFSFLKSINLFNEKAFIGI